MSGIQKFSIKKINKIRKLLLLYIDKDLKFQYKSKRHKDSITPKFEDNNKVYQEAYSISINIEENFYNFSNVSNVPEEINDLFPVMRTDSNINSKISFNYNINESLSYSFKSTYSNNNNNKEKTLLPVFKKKQIYINKLEKNFIIIKQDKLRLKKKIDSMSYLFNLYRNFKCPNKRKRCLSCVKIKKEKNKKDNKETILEVKKKQKGKNNNEKKNEKSSFSCDKKKYSVPSSVEINELNGIIKKSKRRSLFFQGK